MKKYVGKGVCGAIAIGKIVMHRTKKVSVNRTRAEDAEDEWKRVEAAKMKAVCQLQEIYGKAVAEIGAENALIFETHMMMLEDEEYNASIREQILQEKVNAEYAVAAVGERFVKRFEAAEDAYMQARADDMRDISNRIIACLKDDEDSKIDLEEKGIICVEELAPSEVVSLERDKVGAIVMAYGSASSHTAILARLRNIPAIVGVGRDFLEELEAGTVAIVDGFTGELMVGPDTDTMEQYLRKQQEEADEKALLQQLKGKENVTLDGTKINICANIGSTEQIGEVSGNDADGIGLFRSECLYLEKSEYPTEKEQFEAYKKVLEGIAPKRVIIRTLDMGADKQVDYFQLDKEENPALGLRGIRLSLTRPDVFKTQLRALYRASAYGRLGILFPMLASVSELEEILGICEQVKTELDAEEIDYAEDVELGIMIETPAAAIISDKLGSMVDFFSVGTNDLTQYTLACDRQNPNMESFCDTHHEAVLRLIEMAVGNAHANGAWIGICGELASDTTLTETFLRMGIDELSVVPALVLKLRSVVREINLKK